MFELFEFEFMRNAVYASLLASAACGVIGSLVVVNRLVFLAGGMAHAAYGGIGLAFYLGWPVLPCTIGFTVAAIRRTREAGTDVRFGVNFEAGLPQLARDLGIF